MTKSYTVGLIAAPEFAENISHRLVEKLPKSLKKYISNSIDWEMEMEVDSMTGAAETVEEIFKEAAIYKQDKQWDYVVCLTDLPIFHYRDIVAADINEDKGIILLSIPAFGWGSLLKNIKNAIIYTFKEIDNQEFRTKEPKGRIIWREFSILPIKRIKVRLTETNNIHTRYIVYPKVNGWLRLLSGMAYANDPVKMMSNLTSVVAVAFTTGGFGLIFTTMWTLSHLFSDLRLTFIMLLAIVGMVVWIILAHELWEPIKTSSYKRISRLYNLTTILTLSISVLAYYLAVFILFLATSSVLIPPDYLGEILMLEESATFINYLNIAWFAASLSTVAGAIGVGLENEEVVRDSTYGYRQKRRYEEVLKKKREQAKLKEYESENYDD